MTRSQLIAFRLTPEEYAGLAAAARAGRLAPAAWCRRAVLEQLAGGAAPAAGSHAAAVSAPAARVPAGPAVAAEALSCIVGARLTPSQHFDLEARARAAGVTVGTYLRHLVRGQPPTARWPLARAAIVQLARVGNNLNQLVKLAHSGAPLSLELYAVVQQVLAEVRRVRRALQVEPRG